MGSSKSSESKSYSGSGQPWATGYAKWGLNQVQDAYRGNNDITMGATGKVGGLSDQIAAQYGAGQEAQGFANQYYKDVLSGKYMDGNPYMDQIAGKVRANVTDGVNSQFSLGGRYGSGAHTGVLTEKLADAENQLRFNDYNNQAARMDQAAAAANASNAQLAGQAIGGYGAQGQMPWIGMNSLSNSMGALMSGGSSRSVSYAPSPIWGALGAGLGAAGAIWSDRRLKTRIEAIGKNEKGLTVYRFAYRSLPDVMVTGFMADEVKKIVPEAHIPNYRGSGFDGVNMALCGSLKVAESA